MVPQPPRPLSLGGGESCEGGGGKGMWRAGRAPIQKVLKIGDPASHRGTPVQVPDHRP